MAPTPRDAASDDCCVACYLLCFSPGRSRPMEPPEWHFLVAP